MYYVTESIEVIVQPVQHLMSRLKGTAIHDLNVLFDFLLGCFENVNKIYCFILSTGGCN